MRSTTKILATAVAACALAGGESAEAQYIPQQVPAYVPQQAPAYVPQQAPAYYPQTQPTYYPQTQPAYYPPTQPAYPQSYPPAPTYPQYPVHQTQPQISGFTPTGGINTQGTTLYNSAYDPFRQASMNNGTMQNVTQPILGPNGQIVGFQTGQQWQNSVTGQTHFQGQVITPNGLGGFNTQTQIRSGNPMAGGATAPRPAQPQLPFGFGRPR